MAKFRVVLLTLLLVFVCALSYASVGVRVNNVLVGTATDLDFGQAQTSDGSVYHIGNSTAAEVTTAVTVIPLTYSNVPVLISGRTVTLAAGTQGQVIRIIGVDRVSGTLTISPNAGIGWSSATMATTGYTITLMYLTSTYTGAGDGWVVVDYYGTTVS